MIPPIDMAMLSPPAQKIAGAGAPPKLQEMAARGIAPGVRPGELIAVLVLLSTSDVPNVAPTAQATLRKLPDQLLAGALSSEIQPAALHAIAVSCYERLEIMERVFGRPELAAETVEDLAKVGSEKLCELIATNEDRLLKNPTIIEALYMNKQTRMSTADRLIELAVRNQIHLNIPAFKEASQAILNELILEPSDDATPDDVLFQETDKIAEDIAARRAAGEDTHEEDEEGNERLKKELEPLYKRFADMTPSQKIRLAQVGNREARMLAVRDSNRVVASAAVRSPMMQEDEAVLISRNRNISDDVLRIIGTTPEWTKSYTVKKNLVENPKTPIMISSRLVTHLREADLKAIAKSKNVTGPIQDAARRHLERRK